VGKDVTGRISILLTDPGCKCALMKVMEAEVPASRDQLGTQIEEDLSGILAPEGARRFEAQVDDTPDRALHSPAADRHPAAAKVMVSHPLLIAFEIGQLVLHGRDRYLCKHERSDVVQKCLGLALGKEAA
jgi:hypothetical protein